MVRRMSFHLQSMAEENTDENTDQPAYRLSLAIFLKSPVQAESIPGRSDKDSFYLPYVSSP